jgi:hypothetical protein
MPSAVPSKKQAESLLTAANGIMISANALRNVAFNCTTLGKKTEAELYDKIVALEDLAKALRNRANGT